MFAPSAGTRSGRTLFFVAALVGLGLTGLVVLHVPGSSSQDGSASVSDVAALHPKQVGVPVRLKIPAIKVDAAVEHVGLTPDGAMDVPKDPAATAWYAPGPRPGANGSAVIDGHFDLANGTPAVFDNLHKVRQGDKLHVVDANGATTTFIVHGFRTYRPEEDATSVFVSSDGRAHLNLITCSGTWSQAQQSYSNRLVVFADKVASFELSEFGLIQTVLPGRLSPN